VPSTDLSFQTTKIAMIAKTTVDISKFGIVKTLVSRGAGPSKQRAKAMRGSPP
jgi:hypothetical protein